MGQSKEQPSWSDQSTIISTIMQSCHALQSQSMLGDRWRHPRHSNEPSKLLYRQTIISIHQGASVAKGMTVLFKDVWWQRVMLFPNCSSHEFLSCTQSRKYNQVRSQVPLTADLCSTRQRLENTKVLLIMTTQSCLSQSCLPSLWCGHVDLTIPNKDMGTILLQELIRLKSSNQFCWLFNQSPVIYLLA